jgi:hypothetical protein
MVKENYLKIPHRLYVLTKRQENIHSLVKGHMLTLAECGQTFEVDKQDAQKGIKHERENCRENEDWTCEKTKTDND